MSTTGTYVTMGNFEASTTYNYRMWQAKSDDSYSVVPSYTSTFTTATMPVRPSNWSWINPITSGGSIYSVVGKNLYIMPATEWNSFTSRINEFRVYKGLSNYTFTSASSESGFTKTIINQALSAIRDMSGSFTGGNTLPSNRVTGDNIFVADYFVRMKNCLNSIG